MNRSLSKIRKTVLTVYAVILSIGGVYTAWILLGGWVLPCSFYTTTGFLCPGCGSTRMFLSLFRGDVPTAFCYNPPLFCMLVFWNLIALFLVIGKPRFLAKPAVLYTLFGISMGLFILFGFLRNFS